MDVSPLNRLVDVELSDFEKFSLLEGEGAIEVEQAAGKLSSQIREILARFRAKSPKQNDGTEHWAIYSDLSNQPANVRGIIGIPTRGCSYARTDWAGCSVCGHSASTLWNPKIQGNAILDDFCRSLIEISEFRPATLCLYTSGSFLDDGEIPWSVCATILAEVAALGWVKTVCIESLPHFVTPQRLDVLRKEFPSLSFSIAMGVDSIDRFVRYFCFQRTTPLSRYETAIQHCRDRGIETVAYVVHKPPFLTVEESVADTALSIQGAFDLGFSFVSIEPVTLQAGTLQSLLRTSNLYDLPNIWSIASVLAAFASIDKAEVQNLQRVRLGGQVFTPLPNTVMTCCKDCLALIHSRLSFLPHDFFGELALAAPGDCCKNQQFWLGTRREIESVVGRAGSIISKASDFLTSS